MTLEEFDLMVTQKALELTKDQPPEFNIAPVIRLVREAIGYGFDIVRKEPNGGGCRG